MWSTLAVRAGELMAALAVIGAVLLTMAIAGGLWLKRRLRPRLRGVSRSMAGRAGLVAAAGVRSGKRWLWSWPRPDRHWVAAARTRRRLWRAVAAAEHSVAQARKAGAPTGDLDGLSRRLRQAATGTDRALVMAGRAAPRGGHADDASSQAADLGAAAGLIQDAAASSATSATRPVVAGLADDVRREVIALSAGLATAARSSGATDWPGAPA